MSLDFGGLHGLPVRSRSVVFRRTGHYAGTMLGMFVLYLIMIFGGLALWITIGITHH